MNRRNWEAVAILTGTVAVLIAIGVITATAKGSTRGMNGSLGPYGITPDGTPIFDAQIFTADDVKQLQGGYGKGYGIIEYPKPPQIMIDVEGNHKLDDLGKKGEIGCSGNTIPPTDEDMKNFYAGNFTPRQDDIMSGCYVINPPINIDCNSITYSGLWPLEYLRAIVKYCDNQGEK